MKVLVIDIGGTHVKALVTGQDAKREFVSGPNLTSDKIQLDAGRKHKTRSR